VTLRKTSSSLSDAPSANISLTQNSAFSQSPSSKENAPIIYQNGSTSTPTANSSYSYKPFRGEGNSTSFFKESASTNVVMKDSISTDASNYDNLGPDADKYLFIGSGKTQTSLQEITTKWKTPSYNAN
jgi:hypothetical protein